MLTYRKRVSDKARGDVAELCRFHADGNDTSSIVSENELSAFEFR